MTQPPPPPPPGYNPPGAVPMAAPAYVPPRPFASWFARVGAYLLDALMVFLIVVIPVGIGIVLIVTGIDTEPLTDEVTDITGAGVAGIVLTVLGGLVGLVFAIWNRGIRQGRRGQSLGKQMLSIEVISAETGQYLGTGSGLLRLLLDYILGNACFLNYLWPLWDDKKQTWHDMIVKSVVVTK